MRRSAALLLCTVAVMGVLDGTGGAPAARGARASSGLVASVTVGPASRLPPDFFGVNFPYSEVAQDGPVVAGDARATTVERDDQLAALDPGTLRWPGGTDANYFRWRKDYPEPPTGVTEPTGCGCVELHGFKFTLHDLRAAYRRTGAPPVFDLNLMTESLGQQVALLQKAQSIGLPIRYVELGNEFYLSAGQGQGADYTNRFPDATSYGDTVGRWVSVLHSDFPGVLVAAVGSLDQGRSREQCWNQDMLRAAQSKGGLPDAVTLHDYRAWTGTTGTTGSTGSSGLTKAQLPAFFALGGASNISTINGVIEQFDEACSVPGGPLRTGVPRPVWITEYNLDPQFSNSSKLTYAHALFVAEQELLLQGVTGVQLVDFWTSFGNPAAGAYTGGPKNSTLTPVGLALAWIGAAASHATHSAPLVFKGAPQLSAGNPALIGYEFTGSTAARAVILNLGGQRITLLAFGSAKFGNYAQVTGDPTAVYSGATGSSGLSATQGTAANQLTLAPYSITLTSPHRLPATTNVKPPPPPKPCPTGKHTCV